MASSTTTKSYGIVLWVEFPVGQWNAILQVSKSPKGDLKVDPIRARAVEADKSVAETISRVLAEETNQLFAIDPALFPEQVSDLLHIRIRFADGIDSLSLVNKLFGENLTTLNKDVTDQIGLAILYTPLSNLKSGSQPNLIRITPQGIFFSLLIYFFLY